MSFLTDLTLDDRGLPEPTPEIAQERRIAIFDLLEENSFEIIKEGAPDGPYKLTLGINDRRLVFDISATNDAPVAQFLISLSPLRQVIKDYFQIVESYFKAVSTLPPAQIEAIDMGRRGIHNEGAEQLRERLSGKIEIDEQTARRLFTLICALHFRG
ncbi:UPF0262 protein [Amylibacter marinus]|uniref:UPF0262 protein GCM10007939_24150 n=1 Tax=Amylibacter marinus TaxID=1475483 RepID=A0ABQ5VYG5_9RHOB|nr:UPF0262 family protein [Amylibacter marinus]GLQ36131.1 UPF0262 protein [Amylibacter marinus]